MRKSDKKIENQICQALTQVCEEALKQATGFQWLTHQVNYDAFPKSLRITCVFSDEDCLKSYLSSVDNDYLARHIQQALASINIPLKAISKHIFYDSEQACLLQHNGNWALRLNAKTH